MSFKVYYRIYGGIDAVIQYPSLLAMQFDMKNYTDGEFDYLNACTTNEDGSEEIVFNSHKQVMDAK